MRRSLLAALTGSFPLSLGAVDLVLGHFEYQLDFVLSEEGEASEGWKSSISYDLDGSFADDDGIVRLDTEGVRLVAAPSTRVVVANPPPQFGSPNEPLWILSQNNIPGELFLGWRAVYQQGLFQVRVGDNYTPSPLGSIGSSLLEVTGTGPQRGGDFAMWTSSGFGTLEFHYNTTDGLDGGDRLSPIPAGGHSHYNWGFTKPGTYEVRFRNEGKLNPQFGGELTTSDTALHFVIPHEGFLVGQAKWRLGSGSGNAVPASIYDAAMQVDFAVNQIALLTVENQFRMKLAGTGDLSLGQVGLADVEDLEFPGEGPVDLELLDQTGPGNVLLEQEGEDSIFSFAESGIYRVKLMARQGGVRGRPFQLTFLVNLPADYSYEDWADNFERTHGLSAGALSDETSDYDEDGNGNGLEFLLFWHGFDPVVQDFHLMPRPKFVDGQAEITFLRDLHKDDFSKTPLELAAAFSPDLQDPWKAWRRLFSEGNADGFYEDGAELGNEISVVMRRKLVVPEAHENFGFFRFEQRSRN